jgi:hypothetical protein
MAAHSADVAIDQLAGIAREKHRHDELEADAKAEVAKRIERSIDSLRATLRDLDSQDLDA